MNSSSIYDPVNRIDVPPSRHAVESDSESDSQDDIDDAGYDESDDDLVKDVQLEGSLDALRGKDLILLVDQVGETLAGHLSKDGSSICTALWKGRVQAAFDANGVGLVYPSSLLTTRPGVLSLVLAELLRKIAPKSVCVVTSYSPVLYIDPSPSQSDNDDDRSQLRYLSSQLQQRSASSSLKPFSPPNYLWGTAASLVQNAIYQGVPALVLLAPDNAPASRPQARIAANEKSRRDARRRRLRRAKGKANPLADGGGAFSLTELPESDEDDDDGAQPLEEVDPMPLKWEADDKQAVCGRLSQAMKELGWASTLPSAEGQEGGKVVLTRFVEDRRTEAVRRRRRDASAMYV